VRKISQAPARTQQSQDTGANDAVPLRLEGKQSANQQAATKRQRPVQKSQRLIALKQTHREQPKADHHRAAEKYLQSHTRNLMHPPAMASTTIPGLHAPPNHATSESMTRYWRENKWHDADFLPMSPTDRGLTHGLGLFETILAIDGSPALLDRHLARMITSCDRLGWGNPLPKNLRAAIVHQLAVAKLDQGRARVRLAISAGSGQLACPSIGHDHLVWITVSRTEDPPASITLCKAPFIHPSHSFLSGMKSASYAGNLLALNHARQRGFDDALYFNDQIHICETTTSNIFGVMDNTLHYPPDDTGCLPGITRTLIIELAEKNAIRTSATSLTESDLMTCDEVFITSAIRGAVRVARYESTQYTQSTITDKLRKLWKQAVTQNSAQNKA
jgi:branched-subunit amino acid aminotransferase/4-amino-4-deoxychorismate lyase